MFANSQTARIFFFAEVPDWPTDRFRQPDVL